MNLYMFTVVHKERFNVEIDIQTTREGYIEYSLFAKGTGICVEIEIRIASVDH